MSVAIIVLVVIGAALVVLVGLQSFHVIGPVEVGLVQKRFSFKKLPADNPIAFHGEVTAVADHMRVGHDAVALDHKARANAPLNSARIPGRPVIRFDLRRRDADQTSLDLAVRTGRDSRDLDRDLRGWRRRRDRGRLSRRRWHGPLLRLNFSSVQIQQGGQQKCETPHRKPRR